MPSGGRERAAFRREGRRLLRIVPESLVTSRIGILTILFQKRQKKTKKEKRRKKENKTKQKNNPQTYKGNLTGCFSLDSVAPPTPRVQDLSSVCSTSCFLLPPASPGPLPAVGSFPAGRRYPRSLRSLRERCSRARKQMDRRNRHVR